MPAWCAVGGTLCRGAVVRADLLNGRLDIPSEKLTSQIVFALDGNVAHEFTGSGEDLVRVGQQRTAIETQVDVVPVGHNVAEAILQRFSGERERDRDRVALADGFDSHGRFLKNHLTGSQSQARNVPVISREIAQ